MPDLNQLLASRPATLTFAHAAACLPRYAVSPEWQAKSDAGLLPGGFEGCFGMLRTVWPEERLTPEEAEWVIAVGEHLGWRALADCVLGEGNRIVGMNLEEAAQRALVVETGADGQISSPQ